MILPPVSRDCKVVACTPDLFLRRGNPCKWERLQQWCADASALDGGQQYKPLFVREEDWEQYKPKTFHDAIAAFSS